jgi:hypothetical protein
MKLIRLLFCILVSGLCWGCNSEPDTKTECSDCNSGDTDSAADGDMGGSDGSSGDDASPAGCTDGVQNGDESDVDCGGSCDPCVDGMQCGVADDCASGSCAGVCQEATCEDGIQNRDEADVDCGGVDCLRCAEGAPCVNECDCQSGSCVEGACRHSLVGSWVGSPVGTAGVRITMDFEEERVGWGQSFNNGQMECFHDGAGAVSNLTEDSFDMTGYMRIDNSCSLGMFLQGDYLVNFQFTNSERTAVQVSPVGNEAYRLRRIVEEEIECAQPAGPPPIAGEGGFGNLDPYPTYEDLFDAFFVNAIDPVNVAGFSVATPGEPTIYGCPNGGTVTVSHSVDSPVEGITFDNVDLLFEDCAVSMVLEAGDQSLTLTGTLAHDVTSRGIGPEHDVEAALAVTGDLNFAIACELYEDTGGCSFADEIGNVIDGGGASRSASRVPRYIP